MNFSELNLDSGLQKSLEEAGYITAMPVQQQVLETALNGVDLYVQSQTGTGKTAAYLMVIMQRMLTDPLLKGKKALIMVPTRELAVQVEEEANMLGKYCSFKTASFYGGVGYGQQQANLRDDVQIMVGTPGRVLDLNASGCMNLMELAFLVLDEADRMFDMGFYPDLRKLIQVVPPCEKRQTMLFSATLNAYVKNLAWEYTREPVEIDIEPESITVKEITQLLYHVPSGEKLRLLLGILEREKPETAIIFCNTKRYTEILSRRLAANGIRNEFISGDLPQSKRLRTIENIKNGVTQILIATDVAARGIDIEGLDLVVNFDIPIETENYVHRIGRTARAGKTGKAITFASEQDVYELSDVEKFIGMKIPSEVAGVEDYGEDKSRQGGSSERRPYEERRERRPPRRERAERSERGGERERRPAAVEEGRREEERAGGRRRHRGGRGRKREGASFTKAEGQGAQEERPKLSALSAEERKAYYKQKYEDGSRQPEKRGGRSDSKNGAKGFDGGGRGSGGGSKRFDGGSDRNRRKGGAYKDGGERREKTADASRKNSGGKKPEKQGLLSRIARLFGKKS